MRTTHSHTYTNVTRIMCRDQVQFFFLVSICIYKTAVRQEIHQDTITSISTKYHFHLSDHTSSTCQGHGLRVSQFTG